MNTNPKAKTILCYGDSNTYGTKPDKSGRYTADERWTGILQQQLGDSDYIIEEGLPGRTTDLEHPNPGKPNRNGLSYFKACLDSHMPLNIVIIMLGTNDLKTTYDRTATDIAQAIKQFPDYIRAYYADSGPKQPKVILVSPPYMDASAPKFIENMPTPGIYNEGSVQTSHELAVAIQQIAEQTNSVFLDAGPITQTGEDGCHLDKASHLALANALRGIIIN